MRSESQCPDFRAFKIAYVQTIVRSKLHLSRLSCIQNCICPDYRAFKIAYVQTIVRSFIFFFRPCNFGRTTPPCAFISVWTYRLSVWDLNLGNNGDQFELGVEYLCQTCIVHHLIDHIIVDRKGEKPLICREHKMLQHEYCRTCDVTFCWRCTSIHSGRTFEPLEERASELKGKVFEVLTELKLDEKPLRVEKSSISIIEKHKNEQRLIREQIDEEIDKLRTACYKAIEDNCKLMYDDLENISQLVDETVVLQKKLRHLLSSSSANIIKNFPEIENDVILNKINGNKLINLDESTLISCKITSLFNKFKQCLQLLTDQVKSEMLKSCETEKEISEKQFVTALFPH